MALGVSQLLDEDTAELGSGRAVAGLNFLDLRDRLIAGIAKRDVAIGVTGVLPPQPLDECPLALVDSAVASGLLRERTGRGGQDDGDQRHGDADTPRRVPADAHRCRKPVTARTNVSGCS